MQLAAATNKTTNEIKEKESKTTLLPSELFKPAAAAAEPEAKKKKKERRQKELGYSCPQQFILVITIMDDSFVYLSFRTASNGNHQILLMQKNTNAVLTLSLDNFSNMMFMMRAVERHLMHVQEEENLTQQQYEQEDLLQQHLHQQEQAAIKSENNFDVLQQRLQQQQQQAVEAENEFANEPCTTQSLSVAQF